MLSNNRHQINLIYRLKFAVKEVVVKSIGKRGCGQGNWEKRLRLRALRKEVSDKTFRKQVAVRGFRKGGDITRILKLQSAVEKINENDDKGHSI